MQGKSNLDETSILLSFDAETTEGERDLTSHKKPIGRAQGKQMSSMDQLFLRKPT